MNTVKTVESPTSEVDTSWRGMLADSEAVFVVGCFGATATYAAFSFKELRWLRTWTDGSSYDSGASVQAVRGYLERQGGNPFARLFFGGGALAVGVVIVLAVVATFVPWRYARAARTAALIGSVFGVAATFAALALVPGVHRAWLTAAVHSDALWVAVFGYVVLGLAALMTRPAGRREL